MQRTKHVDSIVRVYKHPQIIKVVKEPATKAISLITIAMLVFGLVGTVVPLKTEAAPNPDDLVGWWRFDGDGTTANDYAGYNNTGTLMTGASQDGVKLTLTGNGYVSVADHDDLDITDAITIEARVNVHDLPGTYSAVVSKGQTHPTDASYMLHLDELTSSTYRVCPVFYLPGDGYGNWTAGCVSNLNYDQDYTIAVVFDGDKEYAYVDGVGSNLEDRPNLDIQTSTGPLEFGHDSRFAVGQRHMTGTINDIRIWKTALSEDDLGMSDEDLTLLINPDDDDDGVLDEDDFCTDTEFDEPSVSLGINRHVWYGNGDFTTKSPKTKAEATSIFSIADTHGCSCEDILEIAEGFTGETYDGHYKFGCSKSIIEDFILDWEDGEVDGKDFIETVEVPANTTTPTPSLSTLTSGEEYLLKAYGVANAGDTIDFDAKYSITNRIPGDTWTDTVSGYVSYGTPLLDLFVDGINIDWGSFNMGHVYWYDYVGTDAPVSFFVNDIYPINNTGSLWVDIFVKLY